MAFFAHPLALLGLLALPALAAVYLLRNRFQPQWVSSLMLWRRVSRIRRGGPVLHRFRAPWLFLLELLILALTALAAADPRLRRADSRPALAVILDDSASMTAAAPGARSPRDLAVARLEQELRGSRFRRFRLFLAGPQPRLMALLPGNGNVSAALREWRPGAPSADLDRALALAGETAEAGEAVLVLTDRAPADPARLAEVRWIACGAPLPNRAFVHAVRAPGPDGAEWVSAEVASLSPDPAPVRVTLRLENREPSVHAVPPGRDGQPVRLRLPLPAEAGPASLSLEPDPLAIDNEVVLLPAQPRRVRCAFQLASPEARRLLTRAVDASGRALSGAGEPDLLWTDQPAEPAGFRTWVVQWHVPSNPASHTGPFLVQRLHPLMEGLSLDGVAWGAAPLTLPGLPLVMAGDIPLATLEEGGGRPPRLHFQLAPRFSTLQAAPAWPAWIANILDWRAAALPGFTLPNAVVGQAVRYAPPPGKPEVVLTGPEKVTLRAGRSAAPAWFPARPGVYAFLDPEGTRHAVSVNWLAPAESDLRAATTGAWGRWRGAGSAPEASTSLAWAFGLAALALLALHQAALGSREEES